jgi:hypothetical protein
MSIFQVFKKITLAHKVVCIANWNQNVIWFKFYKRHKDQLLKQIKQMKFKNPRVRQDIVKVSKKRILWT